MRNLKCKPNPDLFAPAPSLANLKIRKEPTRNKAFLDLSTNQITIDPGFASRINDDSMTALLFHEMAHAQPRSCARYCDGMPNGCEHCADQRMGVCMAQSGYSKSEMVSAIRGLQLTRSTVEQDALEGYELFVRKQTLNLKGSASKGTPDNSGSQSRAPTPAKPNPATGAGGGSELVMKPGPVPNDGFVMKPGPTPVTEQPTTEKEPEVSAPNDCNCGDWEWIVGAFGGVCAVLFAIIKKG